MPVGSTVRSILSAITICCTFFLVGCSKDMTPTPTEPDAIDQYLLENPEEAYSSDGEVEEMEEDDGEG